MFYQKTKMALIQEMIGVPVTFNKFQKTIVPFNIASVDEDKKNCLPPPSAFSLHSAPTRFPIFQ